MTSAEQFIVGLQLRHFSPKEILFLGNGNKRLKVNTQPPESLWRNIVPTAWVADLARARYGKPIRVLSGYRNQAYNSAIGGASASQHMKFTALDLGCDDPKRLHEILSDFRAAGVFRGGLGLYPAFVHLDTRGSNADW